MDRTHQEEGSVFALPTPTDTPYRTPPRSRSPQSRRHGTASPDISSSPVPLPPTSNTSPKRSQEAMNSATDENISPLDPRRFTPSLHASLVSEILSLRRDVESKTKDIEYLETNLHTVRDENDSLHQTVASSSKETRSLKRQMQLLEGGTESALNELSKERDEALNDTADLRKRLELSQKKTRSQEEAVERIQMLWERERSSWESEKRGLETKVHIVEGRLKVVLSEMANSQTVNGQTVYQDVNQNESPKKMHLRKGSAASIRSMGLAGRRRDSEVSSGTQDCESHGYRLSMMAATNGHSTSLADELAFDEEEEDQIKKNAGEDQISADELPEERPLSFQARSMDQKARKILGIPQEDQFPIAPEDGQPRQSVDSTTWKNIISKLQALYKVQYVDAAVQYSPPASPRQCSSRTSLNTTEDGNEIISFSDALTHPQNDAVSNPMDTSEGPFTPFRPSGPMISTSCQTSAQLPSPPWTPLSPEHVTTKDLSVSPLSEPQMISTATQTNTVNITEISDENKTDASGFQSLPIPVIAIHPPASRPTTPTSSVVLPPQTKNASCQVNILSGAGYTSCSMQTEEIRVDARIAQLPQKVLPLWKQSQPSDTALFRKSPALQPASPLPNSSRRRLQQPGSIKPAASRRRILESTPETVISLPTPEVEEPVISTQDEGVAGTSEPKVSVGAAENQGNTHIAEPEANRFDEDDIFSRPTAKFTLRAGKLVSKDEPETDYQDIFDKIDAEANEGEPAATDNNNSNLTEIPGVMSRRGTRASSDATRPLERKPRTSRASSTKQFDIRKVALISSGTAAHQSSRDRSPSAPVNPPPFVIPTRHSSRKPPISLSEGAQSPTPAGRSPRKRDAKGRRPSIRKVKSTTNVPRPSAPGNLRRSPSPQSPRSGFDAPGEPGLPLPPLPYDNTAPAAGLDFATSSRPRDPVRRESSSRRASASTMLQQTSVVDAIAQTMVGEWMFKYIRRRKSFGVPDAKSQDWDHMRNGDELSASITNSGVRHKRWVWLAPYERAVMWSSKQPTSGSALMGKSGRKRTYH
jgi:Meiotic cell cortex C-terminal pleckstrin homology